jgi:hypothetical protein
VPMRLISGGVRGIVERAKLRILPLVLMVLGCYGPMYHLPRAAEPDTKPVERVVEYANEASWQRSGYWRITDQPGAWPWFIVISGNTACASWDHELYIPTRGDNYHCKTQWRILRP